MPYTRQQIRDLCRRRMGDLSVPYQWSDLQVNQWINDAIADYNLHFSRLGQASFTTTAGQNCYPLEEDGRSIILGVEYPVSAGGPDYENSLARRSRSLPGFAQMGGFYDVEYSPAAGGEITLWLSGSVQEGECRYLYNADHVYLLSDSDLASLPDRHLELVMLYVRWAAFQELATTESADPDPTSLVLSTLELNAYRAQRLYLAALEKVRQAESHSQVFVWRMDRQDPVY